MLKVGVILVQDNVVIYMANRSTLVVKVFKPPAIGLTAERVTRRLDESCLHLQAEYFSEGSEGWPILHISAPYPDILTAEEGSPLSLAFALFPTSYSRSLQPVMHHHLLTLVSEQRFKSKSRSSVLETCTFRTATHHRLQITPESEPSSICIGPSGQRAVWLEKNFQSAELETRLMRLAQPPTGDCHAVVPLCPEGLPFPPREIGCMAFDEVNTRVVIGLIKGDIWVLDFAD